MAHVESARIGRQIENLFGLRGRGREPLVKCKFSAINSINLPHRSRLDSLVFAQSRCIAPMHRVTMDLRISLASLSPLKQGFAKLSLVSAGLLFQTSDVE